MLLKLSHKMKNFEFLKKANLNELKKELLNANFKVIGCTNIRDKVIIHLEDDETKHPADVVYDHKFTEYPKEKTLAERVEELEKKVFKK